MVYSYISLDPQSYITKLISKEKLVQLHKFEGRVSLTLLLF